MKLKKLGVLLLTGMLTLTAAPCAFAAKNARIDAADIDFAAVIGDTGEKGTANVYHWWTAGGEKDAITNRQSVIETKAGEPFTMYMLVWNKGADGVANVQVKDGDNVIAEKLMAVNGGDWRVVEMELTIDTAGEHVITVGNLSKTINISE